MLLPNTAKDELLFSCWAGFSRTLIRGAPDPDPARYPVNLVDPDSAGSNVSGSGSDPDPAGSEVGSGKYWPDLHNYDIKHHCIFHSRK